MMRRMFAHAMLSVAIVFMPGVSIAGPKEKASEIIKELRESDSRKPVERVLANPDSPGVKAVIEILDRPGLTPDILMEIQKQGCGDERATNLNFLVCQNTRGQLIRYWKSKVKNDEELLLKYFVPSFLDKSLPLPARRDFAQRVVLKVDGHRGGADWVISDEVRMKLVRSLATLIYENDRELQLQGLSGSLMLGKDVKEVEDAVIFSMESEDTTRRHLAFYLFSSGARSEIQATKRGLKGVLNGRGKERLLESFLSVLAKGSEFLPEKTVGMGLRSAGHLAHPLKTAVADAIPEVISLLGKSLEDKSPVVRYRAYRALDYIATHGVVAMKAKAITAMGDFDPRDDEVKTLGGPALYGDWKPNDRE